MHIIFIAACFLLLCLGHHRVPHHSAASPCTEIAQAYDDFVNSWETGYGTDIKRDKFVTRYPVAEQHRVLVCLDKTGRGHVK